MKKWYRKGQLYKRGKRGLALLLSACLIGTMIPATAKAESSSINTGLCEHHTEHTTECGYVAPVEEHECEHVHDDSCGYQEASECTHVHTEECGENGENCVHEHTSECGYAEGHVCEHVHDEECGYVEGSVGSPCAYVCENCAEEAKRDKNTGSDETLAQTTDKLITAWQWIDEDEYLDEGTGSLALPGANKDNPASFDDITALLPKQIQATVENAENTEAEAVAETITLGDWVCEDYPKDGAYSGNYTFTATLPEGYALSEEAEALTVLVELGGAEMYAIAEGYDANGFCESGSFELTNGAWVLKNGVTECATHEGTCNGYQPAVEELLDYDINGDGTTDGNDKAYKITNAGQLYWFADKVNNDYENYKDKNAVLTKDITVNKDVLSDGALNESNKDKFRSWTPIGYYNNGFYPYNGIFDGAGNTITGLYFKDDSKIRVGLFGLNGGTIKNVNIADSYFCGGNAVGGVCGSNRDGGNLKTCNNINSFVSGSSSVGGVCGSNYGDTITDCNNTGSVQGEDSVGGVCGWNEGSVKNCSNSGNVTGTADIVGGVCGYSDGSLETSYNTGNVQGEIDVGGVCGFQYSSNIDSCYNTGNVTGTTTSTEGIVRGQNGIGGVCGYQSGSASNCYSTGSVICNEETGDYVGGVCGSQLGTIKNCYYDTGKFTGKAIYTSTTSSQTVYVEGKPSGLFSNGGVAYLLNSRAAEGSPVWYQNIDNELEKDAVPVLDSNHGTVYASKPCPVKCSNTENTVSAESQAHTFGKDNICTVCGAKGEIIDDPTLINNVPSMVDGVYQLETERQFYYFVALVNGRLVGVDQDTSANAVLKTDIKVNDNVLDEEGNLVTDTGNLKTWVPIGYSDGVSVQTYTGTFDGGGHTISGLYFDDKSISYVGLFGSSTGTIKNVKIADIYFKGSNYVGGVCGKNEGNIEGCEASGMAGVYKIDNNKNNADLGGICGYNGDKIVRDCKATVAFYSETGIVVYATAGGIVGQNKGTIENCYNTNTKEQVLYVSQYGGICGYNNGGSITKCYNTGSGWNIYAFGGICGTNGGNISNCYNTGKCETSEYHGPVGGICGSNNGSIANCYSTGNVSGLNKGKLCGKNSGSVTNCYYLDSSESDSIAGTTFKTTAQFASGEVSYLLNEGKSDSDVVWRQTINTDTAPVLDSTHSIVYASKPCESEFANTEFTEEKKHTVTMSDDGTSHTCSVCNKTEQHADVATFTVDDENHSITAICPSDCDLGTITLSASDATYDGADKAASISGEIKGFDTPSIVYEKKGTDGSFETINTTLKDAGTYRASITYTVDETNNKVYSVSVTYDISPATPTLTWPSEKTVGYTGNAITEDAIGEPTVTLVNGESYKGAIQYSYRTSGSSDEFTSGLPTEIGTYEVKAVVDADGNYAKAEKSMTLTIAWLTDVADATLKDQGGKSLTGESWWAQSVTFTPPEGYTICGTVDGTYDDFYTYSTETAEAGTDVTYYLKNSVGELAQKSATVRVDKTAPTWTEDGCGISVKENWWKKLVNTISFGLFYKEMVDVKVCAKDNLSGIDAYYYYVDNSGNASVKTKEELDALVGKSKFTKYVAESSVSPLIGIKTLMSLSNEGNYVVYAYAVDMAGNRSDYVCSDGVVLDRTAPTIGGITVPSKSDLTLTDTSAKISFTGSEVGNCFYMVRKSSETAPTSITDFATSETDNQGMTVWTANEGVISVEMTTEAKQITLSSLSPNTTYTLYLAAVDKAGNSSIVYSKTFTTCKTMPTITTNPSISGTYGQTVADMTLTDGVVKVGSYVITGTWAVTDSNKTNVPTVGTTDTYQVTFTPADTYGDIYDTVSVPVKPTVSKRAITVAADDKTKTYGQDNPELTFTVPEGTLVGTDTEEALGITLSCVANENSPVKEGGYAITGTSNSANYDVTVTPGTLTINKADAAITVDTGKDSYSKTFGDAAFTLSGISDTNTDTNVQYAVTLGEDVVSVSNGTVTILKAGTATITVSLPASTNYNAADSKTITVTVAKKSGYTVDEINRSYYYSRDNEENIDLSGYLPSNCGTVSYGTPQVNGELYTDGGQPIVSADGKLSYTVKQAETYGTTGTIQVTVTTDNYESFTITVNVRLTDKLQVNLKSGSSVTLQNSILTYGQTLSTLAFNSAVFVNDGGNVVAGTLAWKTPAATPDAGTTSATWVFTPTDEAYAAVEDTVAITVKKATPNVTALPTVAARTYHPTASLTNADLVGGTVTGIDGNPLGGSWSWQTAGIIPTANNTGYVAVFTPTDTANYNTVTQTITVAVSKVTPYIATAPTAVAITYGDTLGDLALTGHTVQYSASDMTAVSGSFAWKDSSVKPSVSDSDITAYRVVFNPSDTENYNTAETDITLTVNKADNAPNMPSSTMNVANSCEKVSDVTLPTGWVWQDADKDTALAVDTPVTATAEYNGADKGNYVNETVSVTITRSACDHVHTEIRNAKEATCKETGYTGDTYCTDCGALLSTGTTIPLADHQGGTATCTKKAVCTVCGKEYGTLDANNHAHTEIKGAVAATCTAGGYTGDTYCTDCGVKTKTGTVTPALGHSYTGKVTTEPTTEKEGVRTYTCERCGHSYTESIPKLPEQSHAHFHIGTVSKAATCTENGVTIYSCSCGDSYTETIPALGHHYVSRVTKQPTTGSEGVMTYTCDRCGHSFTRAIAKLQNTNSTKPTSNKPASSNTANSNPEDNNSGDNNSEENNPEDNKPDTGKPYIKDENGKEGWDVIKDEVDKTKDGDIVTVEMNGTSVVPGDVLDDIKGKDVTIVFDMGGGITWSVNGKSITADRVGDIDFTVKADTNTIPVDIINNVTGERYSKQISLSYDGEFGFTAVLSVNMDSGNAGLYANLFYYNENTGKMEFICYDEIAEDGTAELTFTHASDYAIIIDREPMGEIAQVDSPASEGQDTETETTQPDAVANDDAWNPWWIIIIGIAVIVIGLGVFFVVKKKKSGAE